MTLKMTCAGTTSYANVGSATASNAGWSPISVTTSIPACAGGYTELTLYEQGPDAGVDLYLDDVAWKQVL